MDELEKIRKKISKVDENLRKLLNQRKEQIEIISKLKKKENIKIRDKKREEEILNSCKSEFEKEVMKKVLKESRKLQKPL